MTVVLTSEITIGSYKFKGVNEVLIKKSFAEYADTATIKIPTSAVLKTSDEQTQSLQTAKAFKVGDKVRIDLGYDGNLNTEFIGFVKRINLTTPVEIECEGYSWILRNKKNIVKSWKQTTLKEVMQELVSGTQIKLHPKIPHLPLKNLVLNNASGTQVIDYLKGLLKGTLTACFLGDTLFMGLAYDDLEQKTVKYKLGYNTIKDDALKYHNADDVTIKIDLQYRTQGGQQITTSAGTKGGIVRRDTISSVTDEKTIMEIARAKLLQESFNGYEGTISAFLIPFVQHGYRCDLTDPKYRERGGIYFVESVETSFGQNGAKRKVQIGIQLTTEKK